MVAVQAGEFDKEYESESDPEDDDYGPTIIDEISINGEDNMRDLLMREHGGYESDLLIDESNKKVEEPT